MYTEYFINSFPILRLWSMKMALINNNTRIISYYYTLSLGVSPLWLRIHNVLLLILLKSLK